MENHYDGPVRVVGGRSRSKRTMEKKKVENTFAKPDFAFPETVEKNALPRLEKALAGGDGEQALRGGDTSLQ